MTRREGKGKKEGEKKSMQLIEINGKMRIYTRHIRYTRRSIFTLLIKETRIYEVEIAAVLLSFETICLPLYKCAVYNERTQSEMTDADVH